MLSLNHSLLITALRVISLIKSASRNTLIDLISKLLQLYYVGCPIFSRLKTSVFNLRYVQIPIYLVRIVQDKSDHRLNSTFYFSQFIISI